MELAEENPPPESGFDAWGGESMQGRRSRTALHLCMAVGVGSGLAWSRFNMCRRADDSRRDIGCCGISRRDGRSGLWSINRRCNMRNPEPVMFWKGVVG